MRLTLRTLLAYMDDILEPADHEDLGKKIEASDFATDLIHRSRDTVRRLRLGAPAVLSDGSDDVLESIDLGDANSVAEYLDNTLSPTQVADFERMCLELGTEPDMHLAEVSSCHHVLTMVLGEPAEVDAELKSRMYDLPAKLASGQKLRIEPAHLAAQAAPPVQATAPVAPPLARPASHVEHELPDYLREAAAAKRRSRRWAIATSLLVTVAVVIVWFASAPPAEPPVDVAQSGMESFDGEIEIEGIGDLSTDATTASEATSTDAPPFVADNSAVGEAPAYVPDSVEMGDTLPPVAAELPAVETGVMERAEAQSAEADSPAEAKSLGEADLPAAVEAPGVESEIELPARATAPLASSSSSTSPLEPGFPATDTEEPGNLDTRVATSDAALEADTPMAEEPPVVPLAEEPTVIEPLGPQRFGNYLGNNDVLLIYNTERDKWLRMPPRSPISTGDALLTLPKFRTHVVLADVNTYLAGGTRLSIPLEMFEAASSDSELNLAVIYGRMLLNAGLKGSQVAMQVGDQLREFQLASSASLGVDVQRVFVPGTDYENEAAPIKATWYLTTGSVEWPTAAGGTQTIHAPAMWKTVDGIDEIPEFVEELPPWIDREQVTDVERRARENLTEELAAGQPVGIRLLELTDGKGFGRQKEVRILAAAASVFVGEFEPLVKALNDSDQSRAWETHIQDLRQALASSPDVATRVRQAFVSIRGEEAAQDLMELAMGYSSQQVGESREAIQSGALAQLIKWLDHESLDYRVLAIYNINEITGRSKGYRPDDSIKRRKINLRKIWDEFESNELQPKS